MPGLQPEVQNMRMSYKSEPWIAWLGSQAPSLAELQGPGYYLWVTYNLFCVTVEAERGFQAEWQNTLKPWSPTRNPHSSW